MRNGHNKCGNPQYLCKVCGACRVLTPKTRSTPEQKSTILRAYRERMSLRGLQRVFGVWRSTVMTLTKNRMIREIGRRTSLKNRDVQLMLETLIDVWTETLVAGKRIEVENFLVLETQTIDRGDAPRIIRRVSLRVSKTLKASINKG